MSKTLPVSGMACGGCEENVEEALMALNGIESVDADHESDTVTVRVDDGVSDDDLVGAIESAGYEVTS